MKNFKIYNNIAGWVVFAIAAVTYLLTIEPTASFWDCGEFISSAFKLEVGHPPGAPFFMLTARIFSLFASDPTKVAMMVNSMSALCSAFTILFLFWSITHIARRIAVEKTEQLSLGQTIAILGAGAVGALAYTFSDTFWFSAVEGEVYAYSSLFTAVVFWCILKWEDVADQPGAARWIVLIAYLMGLSIGVHLLNLLAIPAIVLIYYFKKFDVTWKNTLIALAVSVVILAAVLYGMVPGFVKVASWFELFFVNVCGMSFNSGVLIYLIITAAIFVWAVYETHTVRNASLAKVSFILSLSILGIPFFGNGTKSVVMGLVLIAAAAVMFFFIRKEWNYRWLNTIVMCAMVMFIGYTSYTMIVVRSLANTPMDQNSPEDVFSLQSYLNREQYGDRPLFYGPMYSAPELLAVEGYQCVPVPKYAGNRWQQKVKVSPDEKDSYYVAGQKFTGYEKDPRFNMLFPRMYSSNPSHVQAYKSWADIKGYSVNVDRCGNIETRIMPTFGENLRFFFSYQVNFMYWRYFMWNFVGRQNDMQSHGEIDKGNWISGISFIDNMRLGNQDNLPDSLKDNKGRNRYFFLPLLLGLAGMAWMLSRNSRRGNQQFWVVFALFFMTGLAIVVYLNQTPYQPRERDYAYAGSFYAFSIWIGLGVMLLYSLIDKFMPKTVAATIVSVCCLGVPALMAQQNWDDHDRSGRTMARDFGLNYLNTCEENAIIFSNGDNDTFPLWYNQEVEGNRTDVRVCNLSYLNTDWYIDQMKRDAYDSPALPINWEKKDYVAGNLDICQVVDLKSSFDMAAALKFARDPRFIEEDGVGTIVSSQLVLPVDKAQVLKTNTVAEKDSAEIADRIVVKLGRSITKSQMMLLEMLCSNNWERPIYIASTVGTEFYPAISEYMALEGLAYRIEPIKGTPERVNSDKMFDNMINRYEYGNLDDPKVYLDEQHMRMALTMRLRFSQLINALIEEGKTDKAVMAINKCMEELPLSIIRDNYSSAEMAKHCYRVGMTAEYDSIITSVLQSCIDNVEYVMSLEPQQIARVSREMSLQYNIAIIHNMWLDATQMGTSKESELYSVLEKYDYILRQMM